MLMIAIIKIKLYVVGALCLLNPFFSTSYKNVLDLAQLIINTVRLGINLNA